LRFSGEIDSLQPRISYQLPGRLEAGRWRSTPVRDASIKPQSKQRRLPLIVVVFLMRLPGALTAVAAMAGANLAGVGDWASAQAEKVYRWPRD
jgi:hypothetical protein